MDCLFGKTIISISCILPIISATAQESIYESMGSRETPYLFNSVKESDLPLSGNKTKKNESLNLPFLKEDDHFYESIPELKKEKEFYQDTLTKDQESQADGKQVVGKDFSGRSFFIYKKGDRFKKYHNHGRIAYSFDFIKDQYSVIDNNNVFNSTYEGSGNSRYGTISVTRYKYFFKNLVNLGWGIGFGLGFNRGNPYFLSGSKSDVEFKLFTFPFDLSLVGEIPVGSFLRMGISLGPSVMGLFQSRDDFERGEKGKHRRQVGRGGFFSVCVKPSLSWLLPSTGDKVFDQYRANNFFFNLLMRYQYYDRFQDAIVMRGISYGIGFSFEFL